MSWATVVSLGVTWLLRSMSSNPTTDTSAGTATPVSARPSRMPMAGVSAVANTAGAAGWVSSPSSAQRHAVGVPRADGLHQAVVPGQSCVGERGAETPVALPYHALAGERGPGEDDLAVTQFQQVCGGQSGTGEVVGADTRGQRVDGVAVD